MVGTGEVTMRNLYKRSGWSLSSTVQIAFFALFVAAAFVLPFVPAARAATENVSIVDLAFQPNSINVQIDDTVVWTNNGAVDHTVTSDGGAGPLSSPTLAPGGTYLFTFTSEGVYSYHCSIHATMHGTVVVGSGSAIPEYSSVALVTLGLVVILLVLLAVGKKR